MNDVLNAKIERFFSTLSEEQKDMFLDLLIALSARGNSST